MAIETDAQRQQAVKLLQSGRVTDPAQKKALLTSVLAYDAMRGKVAEGEVAGTELVEPSREVVASGEPIPGRSFPGMGMEDLPGVSQEGAQRSNLVRASAGRGMMRFGQGVKDLLARVTGMSPEEREALAQQRLNEQAEFDVQAIADAKALGMEPKQVEQAQLIGRLIPEAGFGMAGGIGRTATRRVLSEGMLGGLFSAVEQPLADDTAGDAAVWASLGTGLGTVLEVPGAAQRLIVRDAKRVIGTDATREGFEVGNEFGVDLTLAEASLDEKVARIERAIASSQTGAKAEFLRDRQIQITSQFLGLADTLNPERLSTRTVAKTLSQAYDQRVRDLQKIATDNFQSSLSKAAGSVGAVLDKRGRIVGGRPVLVPRKLVEEIQSIEHAQSRVPLVRGPEDDVKIKGVLERMIDDQGRPVPMKLGDIQQLLHELTTAAYSGAGPVASNLTAADRLGARNLLSALMEDIDTIVQRRPSRPGDEVFVGPEGFAHPQVTDDVVAALQSARDQYRRDKAPINALADTALNKVLEKVGDVNSETFLNSMMRLETEDLREVMKLADTAKPGMANALRGRMFAELVSKHTLRSATSSVSNVRSKLDVAGLAEEFSNIPVSKLDAMIPVNTSRAELRKAQAGITVLQRIAEGANVAKAQGVKGIIQQIEGYAINAVSQSPFFVARLVAGELSPGYLEKLMYTKEGLEHLATLGTSGAGNAAIDTAVTGLVRMLNESDAELEEARKQEAERQLKQQRQQVQAVGF